MSRWIVSANPKPEPAEEFLDYDLDILTTLLSRVAHFRPLPEPDLRAIIAAGTVRQFAAETVVFQEGEPCAGMFVLLKGEVHLYKHGPQGQEQIMVVVKPVIMFNEVPVLDGGPNVATAIAVQPCVTWQVTSEAFQELLRRYPQIGLGLLRVLAVRNRFLISQYEDLSFRSVVARIAKLLLDLSVGGHQPIDRRAHPNQELAARTATVPEAFSRSLNVFKRQGLITCTRTTITVQDPEALADLAHVDLP